MVSWGTVDPTLLICLSYLDNKVTHLLPDLLVIDGKYAYAYIQMVYGQICENSVDLSR